MRGKMSLDIANRTRTETTEMDFLGTKDLADLLEVSPWRVRRLFEDGTIPEPRKLAGRRAIPKRDLPAIVDALRDRDWLPSREATR